MNVIASGLEAQYPDDKNWRVQLKPLREDLVGEAKPTLFIHRARSGSYCSSPVRTWPTCFWHAPRRGRGRWPLEPRWSPGFGNYVVLRARGDGGGRDSGGQASFVTETTYGKLQFLRIGAGVFRGTMRVARNGSRCEGDQDITIPGSNPNDAAAGAQRGPPLRMSRKYPSTQGSFDPP